MICLDKQRDIYPNRLTLHRPLGRQIPRNMLDNISKQLLPLSASAPLGMGRATGTPIASMGHGAEGRKGCKQMGVT